MRVDYTAPEILHSPYATENPDSMNITIVELARILEKKYNLLQLFTEEYKNEIIEYVIKNVLNGLNFQAINDFIKRKWRRWILTGGSHIITKAALERGDPSFVHLGEYYKGIAPIVVFSEEELKLFYNIKKIIG